ncbi:AfsA-related hotdog domain-containing protein [Photobacterium frigidiphilum]|uniref:AfsA-related hotdog domain-containing protein n=1 Tax=Photobacterium frigidiphilum TaxID=264736 RepID=UPI0014737784|nr:AfsA-related hotdog domain-containing protein [Photobacterium frigidiphilum]
MQHKLAIGERFRSLCEIENCIDIKDIKNNEHSLIYSNGFGLNKDELNHIEKHTNFISSNQKSGFISKEYTKDNNHPTHKHRDENILVKHLFQKGNEEYTADLCLDGRNEFLLDHVNGVHIPGLVFIEATRQIAMSIFHIYVQPDEDDVYFVLNEISSSYLGFAFPIDTKAQAHLALICEKTNQYLITISFSQNDKTIVHSKAAFTIHEKKRFSLFEKKSAQKAIKKQIGTYKNQHQEKEVINAER